MAQTAFILILAPDAEHGRALRQELRERYSHSCNVVTRLDEALDSIRGKAPDVVVAPARLNGESTVPPLADLLDSLARDASLVAVGANGALPSTKHVRIVPLEAEDDWKALAPAIGEAAGKSVARRTDRLMKQSLARADEEVFEGIVGGSAKMRHVIDLIRRLPPRNKLNVLILGETGTGKELVARAIHAHSDRHNKAFREINCAGFNENLLESQLFGHVRGAFTGAVSDHKGLILAADGGTLFLDEIGDMPVSMQAKLLRTLEYREITPVGSTDVRKVDVRLVAATNADLKDLIEKGKFRADLYYRIAGLVIPLPPLRERREDIPLLAHHLLKRANELHGVQATGISGEAVALLAKNSWPGNVRELSNVIEAAACRVIDRQIEADDLPDELRGSRELAPRATLALEGLTMEQMERLAIEHALDTANGNREQAAKMLKIGIRTLYRKIKEFGL